MRAVALPILGALLLSMPLFSCAGKRPTNLGIESSRLTSCPSSPNCVSSDAVDSSHSIAAFALAIPPRDTWLGVRDLLKVYRVPKSLLRPLIIFTPNAPAQSLALSTISNFTCGSLRELLR